MDNMSLTESDVISFLENTAKKYSRSKPKVLVVSRSVDNPERTLQRLIRVAVISSTNDSKMLDGLIQECKDADFDVYFAGSDVNIQGELTVDYLFFEAKIMSKKV